MKNLLVNTIIINFILIFLKKSGIILDSINQADHKVNTIYILF